MTDARLVVIGGSDAGISAALRAREVDPTARVTVVVADAYPNYSICGLPFYLSGETPDWRSLAHRTIPEIEATGVELLLDHAVRAINSRERAVTVVGPDGRERCLPYDRLVVATGALPVRPPITGPDLPGVFPLHTMGDSFRVHQWLADRLPQSAIIVGSGYIGLEMADALTHRGLQVTLVGRSATVLSTVDPALGQAVEAELRRHGVEVVNGVEIAGIAAEGGHLTVADAGGIRWHADLVVVATGVRPDTDLAVSAGVLTGTHGAIQVTRRMETNLPGVYAAGDCGETWHRVLERTTYLPLGTTAHKQGRVAGENTAGGHREFAGSLGTQVVKVFDLAIARTGVRDDEAAAAGFDPATVETTAWDHKPYYPTARELRLRVTGDRGSGRLLGAQILGDWRAAVAKRIDIFATALFNRMLVADLGDLDLSYTPPLGSPWDAVQLAAEAWVKAHGGREVASRRSSQLVPGGGE